MIYNKYYSNKKIFRLNSRIFLISAFLTSTLYSALPLTSGGPVISLPYICWIPFSINTRNQFWAVYCYESITAVMATLLFISVETIPVNIMQQICIQLEIVINRLLEIPKLRQKKYLCSNINQNEHKLLRECISHHEFIYS